MYDEITAELGGVAPDGILKIVLSKSKRGIQKATVRPVMLKGGLNWQVERIINNQAFHQNIGLKELVGHVKNLLDEYEFCNINFVLKGRSVSYTVTNKKKLFRSESKTEASETAALTHDKQKKYILEEGMPIRPLVDLGVFDGGYRVIKSRYGKFRQINRFVEIIADEFENIGDTFDGGFNIIDFGCGKSYLTFILYYYFTEIKKMNVNITGYDLKEKVVDDCNRVAGKYGYKNLSFITGDISKISSREGRADMMITLHACDTATDYALRFAMDNGVRYIFSVPCCQHEVNAQISAHCARQARLGQSQPSDSSDADADGFSVLLRHGLYKERFSALLTDAIRCEVLSGHGYEVDVIEFVDFENTPKNAMIRAKLTGKPKTAEISPQLRKLTERFGIKPTIIDNGMGRF